MKTFVLAAMIAVLPALAVAAEPFGAPSKKAFDARKSGSKETNNETNTKRRSCAAYGEGFVWVEASSSCVKMGGYVRFQTGTGR